MATILNADDLLPTFAPATASKDDNLDYDVGNLTAFDPAPIGPTGGKDFESMLQALGRDNAQLIFNKIFDLPTETLPHDQGKLAQLPKGTTALPREKPVPKPAAPTKWEAFAKLKGIEKKKRSSMVYDETTGGMAPRFGYNSAKTRFANAEWSMDAPDNATTGTDDPWTKEAAEKKARIALNKKQNQRNILKSAEKGSKNRAEGAIDLKSAVELSQQKLGLGQKASRKGTTKKQKHHVDLALSVAQKSTASMGKFDTLRTHEPSIVLPKSATNRVLREEAHERAKSRPQEKGAALSVLGKVLTGQKDNDNYGPSQRVNMDKIKSMGQASNEAKNIDKKRKQASSSFKGKGGKGGKGGAASGKKQRK